MRFSRLWLAALVWLAWGAATPHAANAVPEEAPAPVGPHAAWLVVEKLSGSIYAADVMANQSQATQLAWGPGPDPQKTYLYVSSNVHGVRRLEYDASVGTLSNRVDVLPSVKGNGIAFHVDDQGRAELYLSEPYTSAADPTLLLSRLWRYVDADADGVFGSGGDLVAPIVFGIPRDDHGVNQIQIRGDALFVGSGTRTRNGALQTFSGDTFGESAYGGAILTIDDLNAVATAPNAAGFAAYAENPDATTYANAVDGTTPGSELPYTSTATDKLRVHSAGTRNPFGLAFDDDGNLWFTANFHRVNNSVYNRSVVDGSAEGDAFDGPSNDDVHDQLFRAAPKADYGYRNGNWQADPVAQLAGFFAGVGDPRLLTPSHTFDNLDQDGAGGPDTDSTNPAWNAFHDPANPVGLGPHAAVTGLAFGSDAFPPPYRGRAFVARFNGQFGIIDGLDYRDVVLVDPVTGAAEQVVSGFNGPTDVVRDAAGNLIVVSYYGSLWRIRAAPAVPAFGSSPVAGALIAAGVLLAVGIRELRSGP